MVLSRQSDFAAAGCRVVGDLDAALATATGTAFVIGGAEIYALALPLAERLYVTHVECRVSGDTQFPEVDWAAWSLVEYEPHGADADNEFAYTFMDFERAG